MTGHRFDAPGDIPRFELKLAALGAQLAAHRVDVEMTARGLKVSNPLENGFCALGRHAADTITCRARREDAGRWWYFTSWGEPIAPADDAAQAAATVLEYLVDARAAGKAAGVPDRGVTR